MTTAKDDTDQRWYGRRFGKKLGPTRQHRVDNLLPQLRVDPDACRDDPTLSRLFPTSPDDVWLEIGFGGGEHLAGQASNNPDIGFIGCEPFINGVASLLTEIEERGLENVRVFDEDARRLLDALPDQSMGRIFILFADPWPKSRHLRRRFISEKNLQQFSRLLKDDGELRFASDHMGYVSWTLEHLLKHPDFDWPARSPRDWREQPVDWVETRYEVKAKKRGDHPAYLRFVRKVRIC